MIEQGLLGFRYNGIDKLTYNKDASQPERLGLKLLGELRAVEDWKTVRDRIDTLVPIEETRKLDDLAGKSVTEVRRHYPDLACMAQPMNVHELYQPLQGSLKPYLDGKLSSMPDASDFIEDSLHCNWAYIANLDEMKLEIWKGNQTKPNQFETNRYGCEANRMGFYPCAKIKDYELNALPTEGTYMSDYGFYHDLTRHNQA